MSKKKPAVNVLNEQHEEHVSKKRAAKPETVFKRAVEKKYKAWVELQPSRSVDAEQELNAFMAGAKMGHNGAFKEVNNG